MTSALETRLHAISQEDPEPLALVELIGRFGLYPEMRRTASSRK